MSSRPPDQVTARVTYRAVAEGLVEGDYDRIFRLFDVDLASAFGSADGLRSYVQSFDFHPTDYRLGPLSSRTNTLRFTMEDGSTGEVRVWVNGLLPEVVTFEIPDA